MSKKSKHKKILKKTSVALSILVIVLSPFALFFVYFIGRIYPNVYIGKINVSGKSRQEAVSLIATPITLPQSIILSYNEKVFVIETDSLNVRIDKNASVENAIHAGRSGNIVSDVEEITKTIQRPKTLSLKITYDESALNAAITSVANQIDIAPKNAIFTINSGVVQNFAPEVDGIKVDKEKLKNKIANMVTANNQTNIQITIPTLPDPAQIKTSDANNLGIKELVGSGSSRFAGSDSSRIYNINLASSRLNNVLIAPNQTFSFDQTVGDISTLTGYRQAYIIQNGQTVLGDGGGVCQVSTTMFRAAMESGLPIVERHAHAYRVHYYEEDQEPGLDATIYSPTVDFKFKNDTQNYILIQTQIDLKNLTLTFNFYGTKDGRTVDITTPTLWGYEPAPSPLYIDDPTLPIGTTKQIDFAASGIKSQFTYTVTKDGSMINKQIFYSNFRPWQAKFLRGTKI